jgi:hypothetical protein
VDPLLGRDHPGVDPEQGTELDVVPGLLAQLADGGLLDCLVQLDAASGQGPLRDRALVPQGEQDAVGLVDDHGVGGQVGVVVGEIHGAER